MRKIGGCAVLAAIVLMAAAGDAFAASQTVNCVMNGAGALAGFFTSGGTSNTTYLVTGPCGGNFSVTQDNIAIVSSAGITTINGLITIQGASNILLQDLLMNGGLSVSGPASVTIQENIATSMIQNGGDGVIATGPAQVTIINTTIQNNGAIGVHAIGGAAIAMTNDTVSGNGIGGVVAEQNSTVTFGSGTISSPSGPLIGPAVVAVQSSSVALKNLSTVTGPDSAPTIVADQHSAVFINGADSSISTSSSINAGPAVVALHSSSATLDSSTPFTPGNVTGPIANHTILAAQGSSVFLRGMNVTADTPPVSAGSNAQLPFAVIAAADSSSVVLAGGNTITNSAAGGVAVLIRNGSSLEENNGSEFGGAAAADSISGNGRIQTQSAVELQTVFDGGGVTGLHWTGNILLSQASSFRVDGFVQINGTLTLDQAANAYFNHSTGSIIDITLVRCNSTTDHVSNPTFVTPPITIGPPPGCALF